MPSGWRGFLFGARKNLLDPRIHQHIALIAFFAWVGLGSDGLSSSCYGPQEAFLQLGGHRHLALYLVVATVLTVFLISASYSQIIELFPSGGGGYLVASKLLGPMPGVISGSALVVDYVLTICTSVASGCDAIFSFMPAGAQALKLPAEFGVVLWLVVLNLRGAKESILVLTPIFLSFILSHAVLLSVGIFGHGAALPGLVSDTVVDTRAAVSEMGGVAVLLVFLRAFSLGGGTFTGIEAVSNGVGILREPRVKTGKKTMFYMSISLAATAGGILLGYLLNNVRFQPPKTLNASLWEQLAGHWHIGGFNIGMPIVVFTLLSEGALLFVAAQTGFLDGPRTLAAMAADNWVPKRFGYLSERLVTLNGIIGIGIAAFLALAYTHGDITILIVMYSINVFATFTLSQLGMAKHWIQTRRDGTPWKRRFLLASVGTLVCGTILMITSFIKFREGGWVTLLVTAFLVGACIVIKRHYVGVKRLTAHLDETLINLPLPPPTQIPEMAVDGPTAVVLVNGYNGLGVHTLLSIQRVMPRQFKNVVFCSVGQVDSAQFKGHEELEALETHVKTDLEKYVDLGQRMGWYCEYRYVLGTDVVQELEHLARDVVKEFRRCIVFTGQLMFERENFFTRALHHETAYVIQRRLQFAGIQVIILPIRVWGPRKVA
ncbi:MAG: APC family permease [Candidatus Eisenbacteria bacterium]